MKRQALYSVLSKKFREGEVLFLNGIAMPEIKAKSAKEVLGTLSTIKGYESIGKSRNAVHIIIPARDTHVEKSFRNFGNLSVGQARNLNLLDILTYKYLIIVAPEESIRSISRDENPKS